MMTRSPLTLTLLTLGVLLGALGAAGSAPAALPPDQPAESPMLEPVDPIELLAAQAAAHLFAAGCLEVAVRAFLDPNGLIHIFTICTEWSPVQPAAR